MKKAFSLVELVVAMVLLAFVFAVVPMLMTTTSSGTKTVLNQDKVVKLQELFSILDVLPYGDGINVDYVYSNNSDFKFSAQDRATNEQFANEFLGESDKYLIRSYSHSSHYSNSAKCTNNTIDYIGKEYKDEKNIKIPFCNGDKNMNFHLNSYSSSQGKGKWSLNITPSDTADKKLLKLAIKNVSDTKGDYEVAMYSYFSNIGRKKSNFYNELLPFTDINGNVADKYTKELQRVGIIKP